MWGRAPQLITGGSRVTVQWTDGRKYSGIIQSVTPNGYYGVRFDGQGHVEWVPYNAAQLDGGLAEGGMADAAMAGVPVYDEGATVMAMRPGGGFEKCSIIEYDASYRAYNVLWDRDKMAGYVDPAAIDPRTHFGLYGRSAQEERNNPTMPIGTHVMARRRDGRVQGGTIVENDGEQLTCRWDGERCREHIPREAIVQIGGYAPPPPGRPGEYGFLGGNPRLPPHENTKDWYPDGDGVWAKWHADDWWYEAFVISREWKTTPGVAGGNSLYKIRWADGFGETKLFGTHLRSRNPGLW